MIQRLVLLVVLVLIAVGCGQADYSERLPPRPTLPNTGARPGNAYTKRSVSRHVLPRNTYGYRHKDAVAAILAAMKATSLSYYHAYEDAIEIGYIGMPPQQRKQMSERMLALIEDLHDPDYTYEGIAERLDSYVEDAVKQISSGAAINLPAVDSLQAGKRFDISNALISREQFESQWRFKTDPDIKVETH